ncbi:MAG: TIGR03905 family TSCPD domain-containing protein [Planctomycetes bacterium]|nr:TIGR03905 family TSCPD domain-containing protein [Planctomycetota bacterium]
MKKLVILPLDVCAERILVALEDDVIASVTFEGGCDGNGKALGSLLAGMPVREAIARLQGIDCGGRGTSCADQLARGLREEMGPNGA